jgi:fumarylacetoacetase
MPAARGSSPSVTASGAAPGLLLDASHDPALRSWVDSANPGTGGTSTDFPIQNLPFGVFSPLTEQGAPDWRIGVAIGSAVLDVRAAVRRGIWSGSDWTPLCADALNAFMALGPSVWRAVRAELCRALRSGSPLQRELAPCLHEQAAVKMRVPARIGDYTDFYSSIHHALRVGRLFRPDDPLAPNYRWMPIGYHGRSSSVVTTGTPIRRPGGQRSTHEGSAPEHAPTRCLDFELELAAYVGAGNALGQPIPIAAADEQIFGLCLLNDWSARDIQSWEYRPLGPFVSKSFASTVSPWIVTRDALAPFRVPWSRPAGEPAPLPYLDDPGIRDHGALDIRLGARLYTAAMREAGMAPMELSRSNFRDAYWCLAQMVAHHTVAGCNLRPGDLLGTGTQSGPLAGEGGSLLELSSAGRVPLDLPTGEQRRYLEDGDELTLTATCQRPGAAAIGFGDCTGRILPAAR